jgi:hypothetical protein
MVQEGVHGTGRCAWYRKVCMVQEGVHGTGRCAWYRKVYMVQEGVHGTGRCAWYRKVCMVQEAQRNPQFNLAIYVNEKLASRCVPIMTTASGSASY